MKIKTNELSGRALDWAVAKCEGKNVDPWHAALAGWLNGHRYSTDWAHGGPIVERERIELINTPCDDPCKAIITPDESEPRLWFVQYGPTPLIAAMRTYVAVKLGDAVDVPEELQ